MHQALRASIPCLLVPLLHQVPPDCQEREDEGMSFIDDLEKLIEWRSPVKRVTLAVRTSTVRRKLKIKAGQPLEYKGIAITCVGSKRWRHEKKKEGEAA